MKFSKLALATVAAFGLAGVAQADGTYYVQENLELWGTVGTPEWDMPQTGANEYGTKGETAVWFGAATEIGDTAVLTYDGNKPTGNYPTVNGAVPEGDVGSKYLKVSNSSTLWRMLNSYSKVNDEWPSEFPSASLDVPSPTDQAAAAAYNGGLFVDTLVQFTPSEDPPAAESESKLIVWMNTNGTLCVTARQLVEDNGNTMRVVTNFVTDTQVSTGKWHRLTVSAFNNVCLNQASSFSLHGFVVYVNGKAVIADEAPISSDTLATPPFATYCAMGYPKVMQLMRDNKFFPSLDATSSKATLAAVGFKGEGLVDDIVVSDVDPFPAGGVTGIDFTLNWGSDVSAVWYALEGGTKVDLTSVPEGPITLSGANVNDKLVIGGTAADAWSFVVETTNSLAASGNAYTITATAATSAADVGVADEAFASWTPAQMKAAFGDDVTPASVNSAAEPYLDYQFGQTLGKLSAAPALEIIGIAQNAEDSTKWDITVQVVAGENALSIDDGSKSTMRAALKVIAADTIAGLATATAETYDLAFDETATDLTVTVPAADGQFFKAAIEYTDAKPTVQVQEP